MRIFTKEKGNNMRRSHTIQSVAKTAVLFSLLISILACGLGGSNATDSPVGQSFDLTLTARAGAESDTGGGSGGVGVETIQANATGTAQSRDATAAAADALDAEAQAATAAVAEPIRAELPTYGIDPNEGELGWIHEPAVLTVEEHMDYAYINNHAGTIAENFVISGDITWNTQTGLSVCGFALRSNGIKEALKEYLVVISRASNGALVFVKQSPGNQIQETPFDDVEMIDSSFQWQNDTTNRLTVVARGDTFTIYTNGTRIGEVRDSEYTRGFVAMVALSESGQTRCQFDNTWLWLLDD
jgi:hypothetical protein